MLLGWLGGPGPWFKKEYHQLFFFFELGLVEVIGLEDQVDVFAEVLVVDLVVRDSVLVYQELDFLFVEVQVEENKGSAELKDSLFVPCPR